MPRCVYCRTRLSSRYSKVCVSCYNIHRLKGEEHPNWNGGKSRGKHNGKKYNEWRMKIFTRDNFTCQDCNNSRIYIYAHHIKSWSNHPELRYNINNGKTLCKDCHIKEDKYFANFYKGRVYI